VKVVEPIRDIEKIAEMKAELLKTGFRNYLLFCMGINTGLRISDILKLTVADVRGKDTYTLTEQKTGKIRKINLHAVKDDITRYTASMNDTDYLFKSRIGNEPITRVQAYRILNDVAKKINLDEIGTHTLRKTFGYHFYKKYKDVAVLQEIFNHSSPSITLRYIGINADEIEKYTNDFTL